LYQSLANKNLATINS